MARFSISSVTRRIRENETPGEKYNFISVEQFEQMLKDDKFLEHNVYCNNFYGTPREPVETSIANGEDIILEIDVNGAANVRKTCKDYFSIFLIPPSFNVLKDRLQGRGTDTEEVIKKRLELACDEIKRAFEYDYVVINDELEKAVDRICEIIRAERHKTDRCRRFLDNYID